MSRLFEPEKAVTVAFTSFSTNLTLFSIKDCDNTQKIRISAVKGIYCNSCVSRTLKCNACSRHDVTLRRGKYQKRTTIHIKRYKYKTSINTKTSTVVKDFFSSNLFQTDSLRYM